MPKKTPFFSHDMNARNDPKISAMRGAYGAKGYGWWWTLIELMAETDGYKLDMKSKYVFSAYAMQMQCTPEEASQFVNDCIHEFDLFVSDGNHFWSKSLLKRMDYRDAVAEKRAQAADKRWSKSKPDAIALESNANASKSDANGMQKNANETKQNNTLKDMSSTSESEIKFNEWYSIYPKGRSVRKSSFDKFKSLWNKGQINMDELMEGTAAYIRYQTAKGFDICGAQVFLNQERWKDEWIVSDGGLPKGPKVEVAHHTPYQQEWAEEVDDAEREAALRAAMRGAM